MNTTNSKKQINTAATATRVPTLRLTSTLKTRTTNEKPQKQVHNNFGIYNTPGPKLYNKPSPRSSVRSSIRGVESNTVSNSNANVIRGYLKRGARNGALNLCLSKEPKPRQTFRNG
jgi:hypothetical protein